MINLLGNTSENHHAYISMLSSIYRIEGEDLLRGYGFDMLKSGEGKGVEFSI